MTDERPDRARTARRESRSCDNPFRPPPGGTGDLREKGWMPLRWLALWLFLLLLGDLVFYVLLTPIWLGLRGAAWIARAQGAGRGSSR